VLGGGGVGGWGWRVGRGDGGCGGGGHIIRNKKIETEIETSQLLSHSPGERLIRSGRKGRRSRTRRLPSCNTRRELHRLHTVLVEIIVVEVLVVDGTFVHGMGLTEKLGLRGWIKGTDSIKGWRIYAERGSCGKAVHFWEDF